ncbi:phosphate acyltransferase PlsX [Martelella endophytica]|uniref:Phosphate acyltransferase n=1 Tax=Martelella endophytica TaxID=1486262 RepID=A0A0D5LXB0_MAREN|nr:phosphate acyltransferase PlsX [Martelella endophytica]AJY48427.1 phosphate acyltransferase [Martelella endophytica]
MIKISIDVMGGDVGAEVAIAGAAKALTRHPDITYLLYGHEQEIVPILARFPKLAARAEVFDCEVAVGMDEKPSQALRRGRNVSSMWRAIEAVREKQSDAAVSAGNTGALMAMAVFCLKTMPAIDRPAIAGIWPTTNGESIVLDIGATIGADAKQLLDFALMGGAMARALFEIKRPTVGLLNVGVEEVKGVEQVKEAGKLLREADIDNLEYAGFVEGDDLGKGTVDVFVVEGFTGNIALKTAEGTARQIAEYLRSAMGRTWMSRIGYLFARGAFRMLRDKLDPRKVNGGVFLGLNGIVIKSHGGTDAEGYAAAIDVAYDMVHNGLQAKIQHDLTEYHARNESPMGPEAA